MIFLLIVALIVLVISSFMVGYNMSESDWWKAMYTTLDDCDRDMDSKMAAVDFLTTLERMCYTYTECSYGCPLEGKCYLHDFSSCGLRLLNVEESTTNNHKEEIVQIVEQWGKDHPIKTRQSELLKIFPNARKGEDDIMLHCPQTFDPNVKCNTSSFFPHAEGCSYCRKKYWLEEVK